MNTISDKYQNILIKLSKLENGYDSKKKLETGFQTCYRLWSEMEQEIQSLKFSREDIIALNKSVRSLLLSKIEYYILHYHTLLFCPCGKKAVIRFWNRESLRLDKFQKEYAAFYLYRQSGHAHLDNYYYGHLLIEFSDLSCGTVLLAKLLALQQYLPYVNEQILKWKART